jgi:hypothetical protein
MEQVKGKKFQYYYKKVLARGEEWIKRHVTECKLKPLSCFPFAIIAHIA